MKNPFKKSNIIDTVINVGIGGGANVAVDYIFGSVDALASLGDTTKNAIKIALGAIGGSMTGNKYLRAAADGIAVVGASNLIASYLPGAASTTTTTETTTGVPYGTIGRVRMGQRGFARKVNGVSSPAAFMGK